MTADFTRLIDLASERLGGRAVVTNDEFFAGKENLLKPERPVFIDGKFTDRGKWMDGWETRRCRAWDHPGDWCIIRLGCPGVVRGVDVDTTHFKGNNPEACTIHVADVPAEPDERTLTGLGIAWREVVKRGALKPDTSNLFDVNDDQRVTHLRLTIHPDGGVARLRVYGEVLPDIAGLRKVKQPIDLAAIQNGGMVIASSDMFFGHAHNINMPGRAANMGEGWETRRKRGPNLATACDWIIMRLGSRGIIQRVEIDTNHFKGNFPDSAMIEVIDVPRDVDVESLTGSGAAWRALLTKTNLRAHEQRVLEKELHAAGPCTHVRLSIYPDGGVSRLRLFGTLA